MSAIVIAGASSDTGKTTLTLGLLRALKNRGLIPQGFKAGPDYIDPMFHHLASGRVSYNLDAFMCGEDKVIELFGRHLSTADIGIVEGVMGLYDGLGTERDRYSTAHLSKIIKTPVILVVNANGMSASAAALVMGFKVYDQAVHIAGVILNQLGSNGHFELLKEAIERDTGVPCIGWLPKLPQISLESRHLGLVPVEEVPELERELDGLAIQIEKHIDVDKLLEISRLRGNIPLWETSKCEQFLKGKTIGLFKDKAFNFYYHDNLEYLKDLGANLVEISPLKDKTLKACDYLYIGGGYPEVFKEELSVNTSFIQSLKTALESGLPAYAECGGMMYLGTAIDHTKMVGYFEDESSMTKKLQRFGYVIIEAPDNQRFRAHEFHYSDMTREEDLAYLFRVSKPLQHEKIWRCGRQKGRVIGSYPHIHFHGEPERVKMLFSIPKNHL